MTAQLPGETWIVGCGKMAGAMVEGWRRAGIDLSNAIAIRPSGTPVDGVRTVTQLPSGSPALVLLGIKPQKLDDVAPGLEPVVGPDATLVSILAGVELPSLRNRFPRAGTIIRAMPNLPVSEGKGVVALIGERPIDASLHQLFAPLGLVIDAANDAEFDAVGTIAGAGPAYVARFVAALTKAGEVRGLSPDRAAQVALELVFGTALMARTRDESMTEIARRVASPQGTTMAGLAVIDRAQALDRLIEETFAAADRRERELAEAARRS